MGESTTGQAGADSTAAILARLDTLEALLRQPPMPLPVLTVEEARALAKAGSDSAFYRWAATWKLKPCGQGRYSRRAVLAALEREASSALRRRRTPEPKEASSTTP